MDFSDRRDWRVVLIGTSAYERLHDLPAVRNNLTALEDILTDPELGAIPPPQVTVLADPEHPSAAYEAVRRAAADAEDTLLVYFAGHGLLDPDDLSTLRLAMTAADGDNPYTALDAKGLLRAVRRSPARNRVVILDCCFSGRALEESMSDPEAVLDRLNPEGSCLITATTANEEALAPTDATYTAFTGILVDILRRGIPGGSPTLTLRDLHTWLQLRCEREGLPHPQWHGINTVDRLPLVHNRGGVSARPVPVADKPLTVTGHHPPQPPRWTMYAATTLIALYFLTAWTVASHAISAGGWQKMEYMALVGAVMLVFPSMLGSRTYTLQIDRHGLAVKYPGRRVCRYAWQDLAAVELTDRLSVRLRQPTRQPRARYGWNLPRREGERWILALGKELSMDQRELELALARRAPALVPLPSPGPQSAEITMPRGPLVLLGFLGALLFLMAVSTAVNGPQTHGIWAVTAFVGSLLAWSAPLPFLIWLVRPARVRLDARGLTAVLGRQRLFLPWNRVELLSLTSLIPGAPGTTLLVARVRKGTNLPQRRLLGPWHANELLVLAPLPLTKTPHDWQITAAGERFAGTRWQTDSRPWSDVTERPDATLIPLRLRGITFILYLLAALVLCLACGLLAPAAGVLPPAVAAVILVPAGFWAIQRLVAGDSGELRIDQYGITGRVLGYEFTRVPWSSVLDAQVQSGRGLSLRIVVKSGHGKAHYPLARHTLDGVEVFPVPPLLGYIAATARDLEVALDRFWARPSGDRPSNRDAPSEGPPLAESGDLA
ncbi:caspase family protein [Streptomyces sp. NPDC006668]|uniref:caspase family protein n=1 Tax=Streptomyces sp. NPDC006668 TaxID=3156903 RepID=UPI0033C0187E